MTNLGAAVAELRSGRVMGVARFVQVMHKKHLSNVYSDFFCLFVFLWCYQLLMQLFLNKINFVFSTN